MASEKKRPDVKCLGNVKIQEIEKETVISLNFNQEIEMMEKKERYCLNGNKG